MSDFSLPDPYSGIKRVRDFEELISTPFSDGVNALCWVRELPGDFAEVAAVVDAALASGAGREVGVESGGGDCGSGCGGGGEDEDEDEAGAGDGGDGGRDGVLGLDEDFLESLELSEAGRIAVGVMVKDFRRLRERGLQPELNAIRHYPRDEGAEAAAGGVRTDVYSWHADSATTEADTWLCTYSGACSEGLPNDQAQCEVEVPATRAALLREFAREWMEAGGDPREAVDGAAFREFLSDNCYDLHYVERPGALPYGFGTGNLWRIAVEHPGCPVPPCIHRAPETRAGGLPRLLLIS